MLLWIAVTVWTMSLIPSGNESQIHWILVTQHENLLIPLLGGCSQEVTRRAGRAVLGHLHCFSVNVPIQTGVAAAAPHQ